MSKQTTLKDCESSSKSHGSQKYKTIPVADVANAPTSPQSDLAAVLKELQSLRSTVTAINTKISALDDFGAKLDNVERRMVVTGRSVDAVQKSFADL